MPIVTRLANQKRGGFINLYIDDQFYCGLSLNQVANWRLYKGLELTSEQLANLRTEAEESKAYRSAIRYLSLRIHSVGEVRTYLSRKGFGVYTEKIIARLQREGYLDDRDFTKRWVRMRYQMLRSPQFIRKELFAKGISSEIIEDCIDCNKVDDIIEQLINKKRGHYKYDTERLTRYLMSRGFSYYQIKPHLENLDK